MRVDTESQSVFGCVPEPISLLPTISKGREAVVAARLSYMAEEHKLLPVNHFRARPRRSAEQALNVLVEGSIRRGGPARS
jgi:hypothetical protein